MAAILVADDEQALRGVMARFFSRDNHEVLEAGDGIEALAVLRGSSVDVAFIDVMMPEMDGVTLMRRLLQDRADVGIVMMSAYHQVLDLPLRERELVHVLRKPFTLDELKTMLEAALNKQRHLSGG